MTHAGPWRRLWMALIHFDATKINLPIAIRNTVGVIVPLAGAAALGNPSAGVVVALGALNVAYADGTDPYPIRARRLLGTAAMSALAVSFGAIAGANGGTAVAAETLWAFAAGMLVVLGQRATDLGVITLVTVVVFAARGLTPLEAVETGAIALVGGIFQTLLSIASWPVHRLRPERRTIASLYHALAELAVSHGTATASPPVSSKISETWEIVNCLRFDHTEEAERYVSLLNQAERIRLSLVALARMQRRMGPDEQGRAAIEATGTVMAAASASLEQIAEDVAQATGLVSLGWFNQKLRDFHAGEWSATESLAAALLRDTGRQMEALAGQLRAAASLAGGVAETPVVRQAESRPSWRLRFAGRLARLQANLSLHSTAFRHALRLAICVGLGDLVGRSLGLERTYWIPMTVAIVLKPDFSGTFSRGILRLAGTLAGLLIATALFRAVHIGLATDILLLAVFAFLMRWIGSANYGIFVAMISALVVLLIAVTGVNPADVIRARALNTAAGGLLALLAYAVWPTWEKGQVGSVLAEMLELYAEYFSAVMHAYREPATGTHELDRLRSRARVARSNAEASIDRVVSEPGITPAEAQVLMAILANSHAFAHSVITMEAGLVNTPSAPAKPAAIEFASAAESVLRALSGRLSGTPLPAELPELRQAYSAMMSRSGDEAQENYALVNIEMDRVATSLNTLREQVAEWAEQAG